jgi:hypothetical protein
LIQRAIEAASIPTVGITIVREFTEKVKPPRSIYLQWPFGHPLGEPFRIGQQSAVLQKAFEALYHISEPGEIVDIMFKWRRERYNRPPWIEWPARDKAA